MRFLKRSLDVATLAVLGVVSFTAVAAAAGEAIPPDEDLLELARQIFEAVTTRHYLTGVAIALGLSVALARKLPGRVGRFFATDFGGALGALGISFFGAMATGFAGGIGWGAFTWSTVIAAAKVAAIAAGGYALIKKLLVDPLTASRWYQESAPAWLKSALQVVLWIFERPSPIPAAEAAGDAAVKATPAKGANGITGEPKDF